MAFRNKRQTLNRLDRLPEAAQRNVGKALFAAGQLIENEYALSITRGSVSGAGHVASKPGEAPNADTQRLSRSAETVQIAPLKVKVQVTAPYAAALELGNSRVAARPALRPARDKMTPRARELVRKGLNAAANQSNRGA